METGEIYKKLNEIICGGIFDVKINDVIIRINGIHCYGLNTIIKKKHEKVIYEETFLKIYPDSGNLNIAKAVINIKDIKTIEPFEVIN